MSLLLLFGGSGGAIPPVGTGGVGVGTIVPVRVDGILAELTAVASLHQVAVNAKLDAALVTGTLSRTHVSGTLGETRATSSTLTEIRAQGVLEEE